MTDPTDPTDPVVPVDPAEPVVPVDRADPVVPIDPADPVVPVDQDDPVVVAAPRPRPSGRAIGAWLVFAGIVVALDGWAGGVAAVVVAASTLAGLRPRVLGAVGVAALLAVPVAVLVEGVPSAAEVSPSFVSRSLWPHHLTFVGLVLVGTWVVLDVVAHRRAALEQGRDLAEVAPDVEAPLAGWGDRARVGLVAAVAVAAVVASAAVLVQ